MGQARVQGTGPDVRPDLFGDVEVPADPGRDSTALQPGRCLLCLGGAVLQGGLDDDQVAPGTVARMNS